MVATLPDLDIRVTALEKNAIRNKEDFVALEDTIIDTRTRVRNLAATVDVFRTETNTRLTKVESNMEGLRSEMGILRSNTDRRLANLEDNAADTGTRVRRLEVGMTAIADHFGVKIPAIDD